MTFDELAVGDTFDWIDPTGGTYNSFFKRCAKIDRFRYIAIGEPDNKIRVGSLKASVYHVDAKLSWDHVQS